MNSSPSINVWEWMQTMRAAGDIKRYHTARMLRTQTVAAHTWGVLLALVAAGESEDIMLMHAALMHDMPELETGDVPATAKWRSPELATALENRERVFEEAHGLDELFSELDGQQRALLKWADLYELCCWCLEEAQMGNRYAIVILQRGYNALAKAGAPTPRTEQLNQALMNNAQEWL